MKRLNNKDVQATRPLLKQQTPRRYLVTLSSSSRLLLRGNG